MCVSVCYNSLIYKPLASVVVVFCGQGIKLSVYVCVGGFVCINLFVQIMCLFVNVRDHIIL